MFWVRTNQEPILEARSGAQTPCSVLLVLHRGGLLSPCPSRYPQVHPSHSPPSLFTTAFPQLTLAKRLRWVGVSVTLEAQGNKLFSGTGGQQSLPSVEMIMSTT